MLILHGHTGKVRSLGYAPDGTLLASGGDDGDVKLWDLTRRCERDTLVPSGHWYQQVVTAVRFVLGGLVVAAVSERREWSELGEVRLWQAATGHGVHSFSGCIQHDYGDGWHYVKFAGLAFEPAAKLLATGSSDRSIRLWDLERGHKRVPLWGHAQAVQCVAFAPDGRWLASGSADRTVKLWDVTKGGLLKATLRHRTGVNRVAFSPDGRILAAAAGWRVRLWDLPAGSERALLRGHRDTVTSLAFAPDGRTLLSGSWDRTIRAWDVDTGRGRACLDWGIGRVHALAIAPDGMTAAAGGDSPDFVLWDMDESLG